VAVVRAEAGDSDAQRWFRRTPAGGYQTFEGHDLLTLSIDELRQVRGRRIGMIFQDPMMALNPVFTIGWQIGEALREHFGLSIAKRSIVWKSDPKRHAGGMWFLRGDQQTAARNINGFP